MKKPIVRILINKEKRILLILLFIGCLQVPKSMDEVYVKNDYKFRADIKILSSQQVIFNFA